MATQVTTTDMASHSTYPALTPFWNGPGTTDYWTTATVGTVTTFGYTYPELAQIANSATPQADMLQIVTRLYGLSFIFPGPIDLNSPIRFPIPGIPPVVNPVFPPPRPTPPIGPPRPPVPPGPFSSNVIEAWDRDLLQGPAQTVMRGEFLLELSACFTYGS